MGLSSGRLWVQSPFGQWAAADCAAPPTAIAGQYATSNCKPPLFGIPCKWLRVAVYKCRNLQPLSEFSPHLPGSCRSIIIHSGYWSLVRSFTGPKGH